MDKNKPSTSTFVTVTASSSSCSAAVADLSKQRHRDLDKPQINSSRFEAYAIQDAIRKLGSVRAEVEAEVMAAIAGAGKGSRPERTVMYPNYVGTGSGSGSIGITAKSRKESHRKGHRPGPGVITPTAAAETQQLVRQSVFDEATRALNVHPNECLYHDLVELNVPPTLVKLKRAPQCEKKVDPAPCLEDYIKPQYCSIKLVRDYLGAWSKSKIPEPSKEMANSPVCPDPYQDDDEYRRDCKESEFGIG